MARRTSTDVTRHTRPCGRAMRAYAARRWRGHVARATRVHTDARVVTRGRAAGRWRGPRVSGPSLEYWGGNAIALNRPSFYTQDFHSFPPYGTKFPRDFLLQATWHHRGRRMRSRGVDRVDPSPRDRNQEHVCQRRFKWAWSTSYLTTSSVTRTSRSSSDQMH